MHHQVLKILQARTALSANLITGVIKFVCAAHLFNEYVGGLRMVQGPSMMPTMSPNPEIVVQDNLSHRLNQDNILRGHLVVAASPRDPRMQVCKRVIGLPGDIICVDPTGEYAPSTEHVVVPKGHVWLVGDNAPWSRDSRSYGPVSMALVRGIVRARVLPWKSRTVFPSPVTYLDESYPVTDLPTITQRFEDAIILNS